STEPFTFAAELTAQMDRGCRQLLRLAGARPDSDEFVSVQPIRPTSSDHNLRPPPAIFRARSSSLSNLDNSLRSSKVVVKNTACSTGDASSLSGQSICSIDPPTNISNHSGSSICLSIDPPSSPPLGSLNTVVHCSTDDLHIQPASFL